MKNMENQGAKMANAMQNIIMLIQAAKHSFMAEFRKLFAGMANQAQHKD